MVLLDLVEVGDVGEAVGLLVVAEGFDDLVGVFAIDVVLGLVGAEVVAPVGVDEQVKACRPSSLTICSEPAGNSRRSRRGRNLIAKVGQGRWSC